MSIFEKILRAGEGRLLRRLSSIAATVSSIGRATLKPLTELLTEQSKGLLVQLGVEE